MPNEDSDYYGGDGDAAPAGDGAPDKGNAPDSNTALLPKSIFGENAPEPGTEVRLRVVHAYDDEIEVEAMKDSPDDNANKRPSPNMDDAESKLGSMATMEGE